jgi:CheY-like chemotaxis protein
MDKQSAFLYVEDDPQSREIMELLIQEMMGLPNLTVFQDSNDFMDRVTQLDPQPDVILLDIHVDPYDGFTMLNMLRDHPDYRHKPIVALTASVMNEEVQQLQEAGFDGIVAKPVDLDTFPSTLTRILGGESIWHILL